MKSTPVAYSVRRPTANPNITQRPLVISFFGVQPKTLRIPDGSLCADAASASHVMTLQLQARTPILASLTRSRQGSGLLGLDNFLIVCQALEVLAHGFRLLALILDGHLIAAAGRKWSAYHSSRAKSGVRPLDTSRLACLDCCSVV